MTLQVGDLGFSWSGLCPPGLALVSAIGYRVREDQLLKNQCSSHRRPSLYMVAHCPAGWPGLNPMGSQGLKRFKMQAHRVSLFHVSTCHRFATVPVAKAVLRPSPASGMEGESRSGRKVLQSHQRDVYTDRGRICGHCGRLT